MASFSKVQKWERSFPCHERYVDPLHGHHQWFELGRSSKATSRHLRSRHCFCDSLRGDCCICHSKCCLVLRGVSVNCEDNHEGVNFWIRMNAVFQPPMQWSRFHFWRLYFFFIRKLFQAKSSSEPERKEEDLVEATCCHFSVWVQTVTILYKSSHCRNLLSILCKVWVRVGIVLGWCGWKKCWDSLELAQNA